ncbi:MAG: ATP-binding protein [Woeseiaceae bacterium]
MYSIHTRILFSALVVLLLFMGLTGFILDKAFVDLTENAQKENLRTQIYTLLATAELNERNQLQLPEDITEPRLNMIESNLHAWVLSSENKVVWQSKSMLDFYNIKPTEMISGQFLFSEFKQNNDTYTLLSFSTNWISDNDKHTFVFQIAENREILQDQINLFRQNLWGWLAIVSSLLIIIQTAILHWGLKPLRQVAEDLLNIESGQAKKLISHYPKELTPLTTNLNKLLESSEQQLSRFRDALGNMAHSLKTPTAVLQGIVIKSEHKDKNTALEQIDTINQIVEYQLQRASVGHTVLSEMTEIEDIVKKITKSLQKIHIDKNINCNIEIDKKLAVPINQGDLYELLGNLIENSFKWCHKNISITASVSHSHYKITIEDDGPGIKEALREKILLRGQRADEHTPGHGLGLAMVNEILLHYNGTLVISDSALGGAKTVISF